jgi:hypothetical protein
VEESVETIYKKKIMAELDGLSEYRLSKVYKFIHLLNTEIMPAARKENNLKSLWGVWKGIEIDESMIKEAENSLFPFENKIIK